MQFHVSHISIKSTQQHKSTSVGKSKSDCITLEFLLVYQGKPSFISNGEQHKSFACLHRLLFTLLSLTHRDHSISLISYWINATTAFSMTIVSL